MKVEAASEFRRFCRSFIRFKSNSRRSLSVKLVSLSVCSLKALCWRQHRGSLVTRSTGPINTEENILPFKWNLWFQWSQSLKSSDFHHMEPQFSHQQKNVRPWIKVIARLLSWWPLADPPAAFERSPGLALGRCGLKVAFLRAGWCEVHLASLWAPSLSPPSGCNFSLWSPSRTAFIWWRPHKCFHAGPLTPAIPGPGSLLTQSCYTTASRNDNTSNQDLGWWCCSSGVWFCLLTFLAVYVCVWVCVQ